METKNMETAPDIVGLDINLSKLPKEAQSSITSPVNAQETPANGQETPVSLTTLCTRTPSAEKNLKQARLLFPVCLTTSNNEEHTPANQAKECVNTQPFFQLCLVAANTPTGTNPLQSSSPVVMSPSSGQSCLPKIKLSKAEREALKGEREKTKMKKEEEKRERQLKREMEARERLKKREKEELEKKQKQEKREAEKRAKEEEVKRKEVEKRAREEERKKKEENRIKAEMEKELIKQEKLRRKKEVFMGYFVRKPKEETNKTVKGPPEDSFLTPFSVKTDMTLATLPCPPLDNTTEFDNRLLEQTFDTSLSLETFSGRKSNEPCTVHMVEDDDVVEIKPADTCKKLHYKLLQFHENHRPAYYGTWRKQSCLVNPRNPFKRYEGLLDYELDSDDEWEEEDPGESISNSEGEDGEDGEEGDDGGEDDGFFVPHGYLSDGEGDNDDGFIPIHTSEDLDTMNESKKIKMAAKEKAWEVEFARKCQPLKPIKIGCVWSRLTVSDGVQRSDLSKDEEFLHQFAAVALVGLPLSLESSNESDTTTNTGGAAESMRMPVPEEAMPDLIRLMHESSMGVNRLMKTFRCYWGAKKIPNSTPTPEDVLSRDTPQVDSRTGILNSVVQVSPLLSQKSSSTRSPDPTSDYENASGISKRQLEKKIHEIALKESRPPLYRAQWYIHDSVFNKYNIDKTTLTPLFQPASPPMKTVLDSSKVDSPVTPYGTETNSSFFKGSKKVSKRKADGIKTVKSMFQAISQSPDTPKPKRVKIQLHVSSVEGRDVQQGKRALETGDSQVQSASKRLHLEDQDLNSKSLVDTSSVLVTLDSDSKENQPQFPLIDKSRFSLIGPLVNGCVPGDVAQLNKC